MRAHFVLHLANSVSTKDERLYSFDLRNTNFDFHSPEMKLLSDSLTAEIAAVWERHGFKPQAGSVHFKESNPLRENVSACSDANA